MSNDLEQRAWDWLALRDMEHPDDRIYSADEMVDAWMAGHEARALAAEADAARVREEGATLRAALVDAHAALHDHYVMWDGEPEDAVPLQLARAKCEAALNMTQRGA